MTSCEYPSHALTEEPSTAQSSEAPSKCCQPEQSHRIHRSISFSLEDNLIHEVPSLVDYTPSEVAACWFAKSEYNSFKRNSLTTLQLNRAGELATANPNDYTMRGLECRTRQSIAGRRQVRLDAAMAVFDEQARQRDFGISDPEAIKESYHAIAWYSLYDAHTQGMADAHDARSLLLDSPLADCLLMAPCNKRSSSLLSKIIDIDASSSRPEQTALVSSSCSSTVSVAGLDCGLFAASSRIATPLPAINAHNTFNLNAFFNDMSFGGIMAVPVAAA